MIVTLAFIDVVAIAIQIAIAVALSAIAARLMSKDTWTGPREMDANANLSKKGTYLPVPFGQVRIGCLIGWVGKPKGRRVRVGDGGREWGLFGPKNGIYSTAFSCDGWHILCVGPVDQIVDIFVDGKRAPGGPIVRTIGQSWTEVTIQHPDPQDSNDRQTLGTAKVFWGDPDQEICPELASSIGVQSHWPGICYVFWKGLELGIGGGRWPTLEFVVRRFPQIEKGDRNSRIVEDVVDGNGTYLPSTLSPEVGGVTGYNPSALIQIAGKSNFPHGLGLAEESLPSSEWSQFHAIAAAEGLAVHGIAEQGDAFSDLALAVMGDTSSFTVARGMSLIPVPLREVASPPEASDSDLLPSEDEMVIAEHSPLAITNPVWVFADETNNEYAQQDIGIPYDTGSIENGVVSTRRLTLNTITNRKAAATSSGLQRTTTVMGSELRLSVTHEFRALTPGDVFAHPTLGYLRVHGRTWSSEVPAVELTCAVDTFRAFTPATASPNNPGAEPPLADRSVWFFFRPLSDDPTILTLLAARVPNTSFENLAKYRYTVNGGTEVVTVPTGDGMAWGGTTLGAVEDADTSFRLVSHLPSPEFPYTSELDAAGGKQLLLIGNEIVYARTVSGGGATEIWSPMRAYATGDQVLAPGDPNFSLVADPVGGLGISDAVTPPAGPYVAGGVVFDGSVIWRVGYGVFEITGCLRGQEGTAPAPYFGGTPLAFLQAENLARADTSIRTGDYVCLGTIPIRQGESITPAPAVSCKYAVSGINTLPEGNSLAVGNGDEIIVSPTTLATVRVSALT